MSLRGATWTDSEVSGLLTCVGHIIVFSHRVASIWSETGDASWSHEQVLASFICAYGVTNKIL